MYDMIKRYLLGVAAYEAHCEEANESDVQTLWSLLDEATSILRQVHTGHNCQHDHDHLAHPSECVTHN